MRLNLKRLGFNHGIVRQRIILTREHKHRRVELAKQWLRDVHPWMSTIFSDEKKFNLDGPDNWSTYFDESRRIYRSKRQMGGGSVMVWMALLPNGTLHLELLEGKVDTSRFLAVMNRVLPVIDNLFGCEKVVFQQDNAPIHTSAEARRFFSERNLHLLEWPARSPDLNPVENVWSMLSSIVYSRKQFDSKSDLWKAIQDAAFEIMFEKSDQLFNLYDDMNQRLIEIIEARGDKIKR